jgi:hypothetical protein
MVLQLTWVPLVCCRHLGGILSTTSPSTSSNSHPVHKVDIPAAPIDPSPITTMSESTNGNSNSIQQPVLEAMVSVTRTPF